MIKNIDLPILSLRIRPSVTAHAASRAAMLATPALRRMQSSSLRLRPSPPRFDRLDYSRHFTQLFTHSTVKKFPFQSEDVLPPLRPGPYDAARVLPEAPQQAPAQIWAFPRVARFAKARASCKGCGECADDRDVLPSPGGDGGVHSIGRFHAERDDGGDRDAQSVTVSVRNCVAAAFADTEANGSSD